MKLMTNRAKLKMDGWYQIYDSKFKKIHNVYSDDMEGYCLSSLSFKFDYIYLYELDGEERALFLAQFI